MKCCAFVLLGPPPYAGAEEPIVTLKATTVPAACREATDQCRIRGWKPWDATLIDGAARPERDGGGRIVFHVMNEWSGR